MGEDTKKPPHFVAFLDSYLYLRQSLEVHHLVDFLELTLRSWNIGCLSFYCLTPRETMISP